MPFIDELCLNVRQIISDLEPSQVQTFYEAVGYMVSAQADSAARDGLLNKLMDGPTRTGTRSSRRRRSRGARAARATTAPRLAPIYPPLHPAHAASFLCFTPPPRRRAAGESLTDVATMKQLQTIIRTNERAATALGHPYITQLSNVYVDLLSVYKAYSEMINTQVAANPQNLFTSNVRAMRAVKKETLRLLDTFIEKSEDNDVVLTKLVPPLLDPVLEDYAQAVPAARDSDALLLLATTIDKLQRTRVRTSAARTGSRL